MTKKQCSLLVIVSIILGMILMAFATFGKQNFLVIPADVLLFIGGYNFGRLLIKYKE